MKPTVPTARVSPETNTIGGITYDDPYQWLEDPTEETLAWQDWMNLQNQVAAAWLIARSALEREESRGSHFRRDHPVPIDLLYNVLIASDERVGLRVWTEPVRLTRLSPAGLSQPAGVEIGD